LVEQKPAVVVILPSVEEHAGLLEVADVEFVRTERYRVILLAALLPLMRQADDAAKVRMRATVLVEEGRQALVALDHNRAKDNFLAALSLFEKSFIRYYDPRLVAEVRVLLGVTALHMARPDWAYQEFVEAHHLAPTFKLDAHYSPQVRSAFNEAGQKMSPPPAPSTEDLHRIVRLAESRVALVLSVESTGERELIKGALYLDDKRSYTGVESRLVNPADGSSISTEARALGIQMRKMVERYFPGAAKGWKVVRPKEDRLKTPLPLARSRPAKPWYLRWYTLAAAGIILSTAITLPLVLEREYVPLVAQW